VVVSFTHAVRVSLVRCAVASVACASLVAPARAQVLPFRSYERLVTSNGFGAASFDRTRARIDTFLEHLYRFRTPRNAPANLCFEADESRNLAFDAYWGVRWGTGASTRGAWLAEAPLDDAGYVPGTNILYAEQHVGSARALRVRSYTFMPMGLDLPAFVLLASITNTGAAAETVSPYALFNFRLGDAAGGREPSVDGEETSYDATRNTFYEYGPSQGTIAYAALSPVAHRTTSTGDASAYRRLLAALDLDDVSATPGPTHDVAPGFQFAATTIAAGGTASFAAAVVWALDEDAAPKVDALRSWAGAMSPEAILAREVSAWSAWHTAPPAGVSDARAALWRQQAAILRSAQVREPGAPFGQIVASLPPGRGDPNAQWNITWVRDMAYAVAALARAGHLTEARDALLFQLRAGPGRHEAEVGRPYRLSVTRYFGDGQEESDCNADGPNIELDGFGLFLWSLGEYERMGGDLAPIRAAWATIRDEIAEVLLSTIDADGTIRADSSIWEVHWNGKQRKFTYTSIAAAAGLCAAARVAGKLGEVDLRDAWSLAGARIRDAVALRHTDRRGALAQSAEDLLAGHHYVDAATVEAVNFGLVDPRGRVATATLRAIEDNLRVASGMGYMRNDDGGDYDSHEWVFVDLRLVPALRAAGEGARADALLAWIEGQARENDHQISELHDARSGGYAGSIPMVGFGAGAYLLAVSGGADDPACGAYAREPAAPVVDGGVATDGGASPHDAGTTRPDAGVPDAGIERPIPAPSGGCSSLAARGDTQGEGPATILLALAIVLFLRVKRARAFLVTLACACGAAAPSPNDGGARVDGGADGRCAVSVEYRATGATPRVFVAGEWNGFSPTADELADDGAGLYRKTLRLRPGLYAYKLVVQGDGREPWRIDPANVYRAYADGVENSGLRVADCARPALHARSADTMRAAPDRGRFDATLAYEARDAGPLASLHGEIRHQGATRALTASELTREGDLVRVRVENLADGKHTVRVVAQGQSGRESEPRLLPFWIERSTFEWRDALVYVLMTDRFRDGEPLDNPRPTDASMGADWMGGDFQGVTQALEEGYFDALGVRAIWLTPWYQNPAGVFADADDVHRVSGFHGYWPIDPLAVDARMGGEGALRQMIDAAHRRGIRVLMDLVLNHVHEEHPYVREHPAWFNTGCVCGTGGCDWTARRLDCLFRPYMPDVDWTNRDASERFIEDALVWMERYDLDGFRVDAVKHVVDGAIFNLGVRVRETFEAGGVPTFLMGETAMGWDPSAGPEAGGNIENYETISRYVGPAGLTGQLDFVLYYAASLQFLNDAPGRGMAHVDFWTRASMARYPRGAVMTPYIGSHDSARFISLAANPDLAGNKWASLPPAPASAEPYERMAAAFAWLFAIPGAPLLWAGDEYGEYGGSDPDNRHMHRRGAALSPNEARLLSYVQKLGRARQSLPALRRGRYRTLLATETLWCVARGEGDDLVIVVLNRSAAPQTATIPVPADVAPSARVFQDALESGATATIERAALTITLPAWRAVYLK
jgi:glycosidase